MYFCNRNLFIICFLLLSTCPKRLFVVCMFPDDVMLLFRCSDGKSPSRCHVAPLNLSVLLNAQLMAMESQYPVKEEEENTMHNTVVIFSSNDSFTLKQVGPFFPPFSHSFLGKCCSM